MIVAVIPMRMMQVTIDKIINVIAMWHGLMATIRSVDVRGIMTGATVLRRAFRRVLLTDLDDVFIDMVAVRMVKMAVMQIINMVAVTYGSVTATGFVFVIVVMVMRGGAIAHNYSFQKALS
ncbi:hypothetical protein [Phyllobacterium sp. SB3]|uniref:hypothetical protein n=1 Tax=Phyllobacterium sp. SB3 TaxID=3156073 RepID=UPI0032AEBBCB